MTEKTEGQVIIGWGRSIGHCEFCGEELYERRQLHAPLCTPLRELRERVLVLEQRLEEEKPKP